MTLKIVADVPWIVLESFNFGVGGKGGESTMVLKIWDGYLNDSVAYKDMSEFSPKLYG